MSVVTHQFPVLETERLTLRPPQMSDFPSGPDGFECLVYRHPRPEVLQ